MTKVDELAVLRSLTRRLPRVRGAGVIGTQVARWYSRKPRPWVTTEVLGMTMELDPAEVVDSGLLFMPQLYDPQEIRWISDNLRPGDCFLDLGANIGFYSLVASRAVGAGGRVVAVEADPSTVTLMQRNLDLNDAANVTIVNAGLSDQVETLRLGVNTSGNRGGSSFLKDSTESVLVECLPLAQLLDNEGVRKVAGAKLDIEGFEARVLSRFFSDVDRDLYPHFLIVEDWGLWDDSGTDGDLLTLMREHGYRLEWSDRANHVLSLGD